jgi:hypothetical protein
MKELSVLGLFMPQLMDILYQSDTVKHAEYKKIYKHAA